MEVKRLAYYEKGDKKKKKKKKKSIALKDINVKDIESNDEYFQSK